MKSGSEPLPRREFLRSLTAGAVTLATSHEYSTQTPVETLRLWENLDQFLQYELSHGEPNSR